MALKATIYKAVVNVADLDRNQFLDASLTLARHPSETQERIRQPDNGASGNDSGRRHLAFRFSE